MSVREKLQFTVSFDHPVFVKVNQNNGNTVYSSTEIRLRPISRYETWSVVRAAMLAGKKPNKVDKGNRWLPTRKIRQQKKKI